MSEIDVVIVPAATGMTAVIIGVDPGPGAKPEAHDVWIVEIPIVAWRIYAPKDPKSFHHFVDPILLDQPHERGHLHVQMLNGKLRRRGEQTFNSVEEAAEELLRAARAMWELHHPRH